MTDVFSIRLFTDHVIQYLFDNALESANLFGYSMGGYVALYLVRHHPFLAAKVITLGTKFHWDESIATKEIKMLQPEVIEQKLPAFAQTLKERHQPNDWREVLNKTASMLEAMGKDNPLKLDDYSDIGTPAMIMLGDRDKMVTMEETIAVYQQLPNAQLAVLPATPHPIEQIDNDLLSFYIKRFIN
jgi:pimeloyl-ACP methyl ester carboxylesterase